MCHNILANLGINSFPNVTINLLQADAFLLESNLLSMQYHDAFKEAEGENTPSALISSVARSLLKVQNVV